MEKKEKKAVERQATVAMDHIAPTTQQTPTTPEMLAKEIKDKEAELQKMLDVLKHKQNLSQRRSIFLTSLNHCAHIRQVATENITSFELSDLKVKFYDSDSYRNDPLFSVSNPDLIIELADCMEGRIKEKIAEIEKELLN